MKTFTFTFTEEEANAVITAIQELPARTANPLTQKLQEQAKVQIEAQQAQEANNG